MFIWNFVYLYMYSISFEFLFSSVHFFLYYNLCSIHFLTAVLKTD